MADHRALGKLGWVFGAVTAVVMLAAVVTVTSHSADPANAGAARFIAAAAPSSAAR